MHCFPFLLQYTRSKAKLWKFHHFCQHSARCAHGSVLPGLWRHSSTLIFASGCLALVERILEYLSTPQQSSFFFFLLLTSTFVSITHTYIYARTAWVAAADNYYAVFDLMPAGSYGGTCRCPDDTVYQVGAMWVYFFSPTFWMKKGSTSLPRKRGFYFVVLTT